MPGLVHTYPDKVLFLATDLCAVYCRYCTRARSSDGTFLPTTRCGRGRSTTSAHAGGARRADLRRRSADPGRRPARVAAAAAARIPHVEFLRIGTKVPAVLPQRITPALVPDAEEVPPAVDEPAFHASRRTDAGRRAGLRRLADAGIPLCGQMVLLKGVNDDPADDEAADARPVEDPREAVLPAPVRRDRRVGAFPDAGREGARDHPQPARLTTGYAVPTYMIDAPGGGGKVPGQGRITSLNAKATRCASTQYRGRGSSSTAKGR